MVIKFDENFKSDKKEDHHGNKIKADIIILGCSLPGIVTAYKLKSKFGDTMDIMVLDMTGPSKDFSKCNVAFQGIEDHNDDEDDYDQVTVRVLIDNVARYYIAKYAKEFDIPIPDCIVAPEKVRSPLNKLFQYMDGNIVECTNHFNDFEYLRFVERFELNQYQTLLDQSMKDLFHSNQVREDSESERRTLLYYDQTTMEQHICGALLFSTSRQIMRTTVHLVCGAVASTVSVLFYLHQCYRTSSTRNHLDGDNTRFREKLFGYCRKRLVYKLQKSIADITMPAQSIKGIRIYSDEKVVLETIQGESSYVCNLLAMALKPKELLNIQVEDQLLCKELAIKTCRMTPGVAKQFVIQYEENFWSKQGYSGDILSIRGPILWAMERPKMSTTGSSERYAGLVGYLMAKENENHSKEAVIEQLVNFFGEEAASPVSYKEKDVADVFLPRCGDYIALRRLTVLGEGSPMYMVWESLDIFADGDIASSIEAGHTAYNHLLTCLRPQAQTFEDLRTVEWPTVLSESPFPKWLAQVNVISSIRLVVFTAAIVIGLRLMRSYSRQ